MAVMAECEICGDDFDKEWGLNIHLTKSHSEEETECSKLHNNPEELERLYHEEGLSLQEISERSEVGPKTISNRMDKFGIEKRPDGDKSGVWWDEDKIRHLYVEEELSLKEVAKRLGCSIATIHNVMEEYGIERREANGGEKGHALYKRSKGYKQWVDNQDYDKTTVSVHQVLACVDNDPHEVFSDGIHVHHGADKHDKLPPVERSWANWRENIELMSASEHASYHRKKQLGILD